MVNNQLMPLPNQTLPYNLEDTYILPFGTFYFYKPFVLSEINEGITFDSEMAEMLLELIVTHYGKRKSIGYISHRVNNYNVNKKAWTAFIDQEERFLCYATVPLIKDSIWNKMLLFKADVFKNKKFESLLEAASWVTSLTLLIKNRKLHKNSFIATSRK